MVAAIHRLACASLLALHAAPALCAEAAGPAELGWLRELAGHCWRGAQADGATTDIQCYELQFGRHLRGTIEIAGATADAPKLRGDSVWSWDAAKQKIAVVTWASAGPLGINDAVFAGDRLSFAFGPNVRSHWERVDAQSFVVVRERLDGSAWREDRRVTYRRVAPAR